MRNNACIILFRVIQGTTNKAQQSTLIKKDLFIDLVIFDWNLVKCIDFPLVDFVQGLCAFCPVVKCNQLLSMFY